MSSSYFNRKTQSEYEIFVNQAGYPEKGAKYAVMPFAAERFRVEDENGDIHYEGNVSHFGFDKASGDDVYIADLSDFCRAGSYRVKTAGKSSAIFRIGENAYDRLFYDAAKAYYYLRCGCALDEKYAGKFAHDICHEKKAVIFGSDVRIDVSGGWHDAGDYGRYVTAASCALAQLLYAYKLFPESFRTLTLDIPESSEKMPDILCECRYELDWLLKMQREDGAVYHKATTMQHAPFVMPEDDREQIFVFPISSSAAADLCAVCALASGIYAEFDSAYAERLRAAALLSAAWLEKNPQFIGFSNPEGCNTGDYGETDDSDNRFWAWCELFALTGDKKYDERLHKLYDKDDFRFISLGYCNIGGLGLVSYTLCGNKERDEKLCGEFADALIGSAWWLKGLSEESGYGTTLRYEDYYWGSNMLLLQKAMFFIFADMLTGEDRFFPYACRQLDVLLGVNPFGISYVTGNGEFCARDPHYRPAYADGIAECVPGLVVGGPNSKLNDERSKELLGEDTPPMKCYVDDVSCYSLNEVTIYWNSPLVFLLAAINSKISGDNKS